MTDYHKLTRSRFLQLSGFAALGATLTACITAVSSELASAKAKRITNPDEALKLLLEGNQRYIGSKTAPTSRRKHSRLEISENQNPHAIILGCVDSRVPPEMVFDQGLGDLLPKL
jgi:carbonic anhydrase